MGYAENRSHDKIIGCLMKSQDKKLSHPVFGYSVFIKFFGGTFYPGPLMLQQDNRPLMVSLIHLF